MSNGKLLLSVKILALFGILLAVYLLTEQIFRPAFQPCNVNDIVNCNAVISGETAKTLGISTPLYGLIGYIVIFFSAIVVRKKLMVAMATFGTLFCLWITYQDLFLLHTICPVCLLCQLDMITLFILSLIIAKTKNNK
jgi:uncharacterized membrane protein